MINHIPLPENDMKIEYKFSEEDLEGSGQLLTTNYTGDCDVTKIFKVGYTQGSPQKALLINMADGYVLEFKDKLDLCTHLNEHRVGFRPSEGYDIHCILNHGNRFKPHTQHS